MKYSKPPLSFDDQADRLISRGLIADRNTLIARLEAVSYYRLSGYLFPFRNPDDSFKLNTTLDVVWNLYAFDRQIRLLALDAIERVEIAVRTNLLYLHTHKYGPFGYVDPATIPGMVPEEHAEFLQKVIAEQRRNKEVFVKHFMAKYGDVHQHLPLWMAAEIMTYGMLLTLVSKVEKPFRQRLGAIYGMPDDVFLSWIRALGGVRNICAHHGRLWNREIGYQPFIPRINKHPDWHKPIEVKANRIFGILTVLKYLMDRIAPQSRWPERVRELLKRYPEVPRGPMGFGNGWEECPIWK